MSVQLKFPKFSDAKFNKALQSAVDDTLKTMKFGLLKDTPERAKKMWEFVTAQDERVCYICSPLDGNKYAMDDHRFIPPLHRDCRCYMHIITDPFVLDKKEGKLMHKHPYAILEEFGSEKTAPTGFFRKNSFEGSKFFIKKIKKNMEQYYLDSF